uniref:Uncharacterized protein n=1 Tax=Arundo donax TaxID=35708 RepID=A0A0A9SQV7_ARUDO
MVYLVEKWSIFLSNPFYLFTICQRCAHVCRTSRCSNPVNASLISNLFCSSI